MGRSNFERSFILCKSNIFFSFSECILCKASFTQKIVKQCCLFVKCALHLLFVIKKEIYWNLLFVPKSTIIEEKRRFFMSHFGINSRFLFFQIFNIFLFLGAPILTIIVLSLLRKRSLGHTAKAIWVLISFVPIMGPLAFWIVNPQDEVEKE